MKKLAVVVIHGMGTQKRSFADAAIRELDTRIAANGANPDHVAWIPIFWGDILGPREQQYLEDAKASAKLDYMPLRRFVVSSLGDAAAYQYTEGPSDTYAVIHDRIRGLIRQTFINELQQNAVPLVMLAHSLGSHIVSSYIWDTQHGLATGAGNDASPFEKMEWLAGMVTFGSNIPLFTFAYREVLAIRFPGGELPPETAQKARWLNYYDKDDVLGYPLRPVSESYADVVDADHQINVGGLVRSATPLSHGAYWTDNNFTKPVAGFLSSLL